MEMFTAVPDEDTFSTLLTPLWKILHTTVCKITTQVILEEILEERGLGDGSHTDIYRGSFLWSQTAFVSVI